MTKQELINKLKNIDQPSQFLFVGSTVTNEFIYNNIPIADYIRLVNFQSQFEISFNELNKLLSQYPNYPSLAKWDISKYTELFNILLNKIDQLTLDNFKFMTQLPLNIIEIFIQQNKDNIKNINLSHLEIEELEYLNLKYYV